MRIRTALILCLALALLCLPTLAVAGKSGGSGKSPNSIDLDAKIENLRLGLLTFYDSLTAQKNPVSVGSEYCLACHGDAGEKSLEEWHHTLHAFFIRQPMGMYSLQPGKGIVADHDHNGVDDFMQGMDFNTMTGTPFDGLKPNDPILSYNADTDQYFIQLGPTGLKLPVAATLGGYSATNGQRFICRVPVSDTATGYSHAVYFGPLAWGGTALTSSATSWYSGNTPKYAPGCTSADLGNATTGLQSQNYLKNCSGCHMTGVRKAFVTTGGEYVVNPFPATLIPDNSPNYPDLDNDGIADLMNIGCESCHGPGSLHILAHGDPAKIVNPADIRNNKERSITCLQCHVRIASAPTKKWGFTFDEAADKGYFMQNPPLPLETYQVSTAAKWPDGQNYAYARIDSFMSSGHYQGSHGIACNDCHNAHAETTNPAQVRDLMNHSGVNDIPAHVEDNSFCLSCHNAPYSFPTITEQMVKDWDANFPAIRDAIEEHTHHPYAADRIMGLSNCVTCHMAPNQGHSFWPAEPEWTIEHQAATGFYSTASGNVNSCSSSCHRGNVRIWQDVKVIDDWTNNKYGTANEVALAEYLVQYYGPGGLWWDTAPAPAH